MKCPSCLFENPDKTRFCGNCATPLQIDPGDKGSGTETFPSYIYKLVPGKVFGGRYQIMEELGSGGMGRVYKALDNQINEKIVIKLIHPEIAFRKKTVERFRNELKLTRKISHRNVCRMFDLHEEEGALYITMEYIPGEDLKRSMKMMGPFTVGKTIAIAKQVCEGLQEAHNLGIFHRDLKPQNIILDRSGNARIMDFGIASSLETKGLTEEGVSIGTPKYMSPEQSEGKEVDQRSDIYSLGVIMYEMVTGRVPFAGDTALSIAMKHKLEKPQPPMDLNSNVSEDLNRLILKCLEKKKEHRYQNVEEMLGDIEAIETGIPTSEREIPKMPSKTMTALTRVRSYKIPAYVFILFALLVVGYLLIFPPWRKNGTAASPVSKPEFETSIAVLPLNFKADDENLAANCDYLIFTINNTLDNLFPSLKVTPKAVMDWYVNGEVDLNSIRRELDVEYILDVNYVPSNPVNANEGFFKVSVVLVDKDNNRRLSKEYECDMNRGGAMATIDICGDVGAEIGLSMAAAEASPRISDNQAYAFYRLGLAAEKRYRQTESEEDFLEAKRNYENAIDLDDQYPLFPWSLGNLYEAHYVIADDAISLTRMSEAYKLAFQLGPELPETLLGMGWLYFYRKNDNQACTFFKQALDKDPNSIEVNVNIGSFLRSMGLFDKAIKYYDWALALSPFDEAHPTENIYRENAFMLRYQCYHYMGMVSLAGESLQTAIRNNAFDSNLHLLMARQHILLNMFSEAENDVERAAKIRESNPRILFFRALKAAAEGKSDEAISLIPGERPLAATYLLSNIFSLLGMKERALEEIESGIIRGFDEVKTYLYPYLYLINNAYLQVWESDPRFQKILAEQKEKHDALIEKFKGL